ncbi:hypothetical protein AU467_19455 [Mesorhizobium loti]|uniref:Uncharacterized protein n=1 Tax=Rhizobium loti TaxID=381 RepID=A0A101KTW5_RHILI|nr:hypothetical protein AU467_19455 [Mesorhizobium loti]
MPRYATIITTDDGAEIVSAIGEFESLGLPRRAGRVEEVAPGVASAWCAAARSRPSPASAFRARALTTRQ